MIKHGKKEKEKRKKKRKIKKRNYDKKIEAAI